MLANESGLAKVCMVDDTAMPSSFGSTVPPINLLAPLFTVDGPVRYSACKAAQDADAVIVRLFEDEGREATVTVGLHTAVKRASLAQTDETVIAPLTIENGSVTLTFAPYKAVTLRLEKE